MLPLSFPRWAFTDEVSLSLSLSLSLGLGLTPALYLCLSALSAAPTCVLHELGGSAGVTGRELLQPRREVGVAVAEQNEVQPTDSAECASSFACISVLPLTPSAEKECDNVVLACVTQAMDRFAGERERDARGERGWVSEDGGRGGMGLIGPPCQMGKLQDPFDLKGAFFRMRRGFPLGISNIFDIHDIQEACA
ncbi:hypothetical protein L7F22_062348, partial [Adiantum nelumboides]|nr:hypothetical protein [Adiantum nelumboides]